MTQKRSRPPRILCVDDDRAFSQSLKRRLKHLPARVDTFSMVILWSSTSWRDQGLPTLTRS